MPLPGPIFIRLGTHTIDLNAVFRLHAESGGTGYLFLREPVNERFCFRLNQSAFAIVRNVLACCQHTFRGSFPLPSLACPGLGLRIVPAAVSIDSGREA